MWYSPEIILILSWEYNIILRITNVWSFVIIKQRRYQYIFGKLPGINDFCIPQLEPKKHHDNSSYYVMELIIHITLKNVRGSQRKNNNVHPSIKHLNTISINLYLTDSNLMFLSVIINDYIHDKFIVTANYAILQLKGTYYVRHFKKCVIKKQSHKHKHIHVQTQCMKSLKVY